jgi:hypothetical protein
VNAIEPDDSDDSADSSVSCSAVVMGGMLAEIVWK